jgi:hypothetical protein
MYTFSTAPVQTTAAVLPINASTRGRQVNIADHGIPALCCLAYMYFTTP